MKYRLIRNEMTKQQLKFLETVLYGRQVDISEHAMKRIIEREIGFKWIYSTLKNAKIMEVSYEEIDGEIIDVRISIRENTKERRTTTELVVSLFDFEIKTTFTNYTRSEILKPMKKIEDFAAVIKALKKRHKLKIKIDMEDVIWISKQF